MGSFIELVTKCGPFIFAFMCFTRCFAVIRPFSYRSWFGGNRCIENSKIVWIKTFEIINWIWISNSIFTFDVYLIFHPVLLRCVFYILGCLIIPVFLALFPFMNGKKYVYQPIYGYCNCGLESIFEPESLQWLLGQVFIGALPYIIPVLVVLPTSITVSIKLLVKSKGITLQKERLKSQRQTAVMLISLSIIFFLSFLPFVYIIFADFLKITYPTHYYPKIVPGLNIALFISSAMNPFIYHLRGKNIFKDETQAASTRSMTTGIHTHTTSSMRTDSMRRTKCTGKLTNLSSNGQATNNLTQASIISKSSYKSNSSGKMEVTFKGDPVMRSDIVHRGDQHDTCLVTRHMSDIVFDALPGETNMTHVWGPECNRVLYIVSSECNFKTFDENCIESIDATKIVFDD